MRETEGKVPLKLPNDILYFQIIFCAIIGYVINLNNWSQLLLINKIKGKGFHAKIINIHNKEK